MSNKEKLRVKKPYLKYFGKSKAMLKVMQRVFYMRPPKPYSKCEHGRVDYKTLRILAVKQANTILDMGKTIMQMENSHNRKTHKLEDKIASLQHDWNMCDEVCDQKTFKIRELERQLMDREEVNINAN